MEEIDIYTKLTLLPETLQKKVNELIESLWDYSQNVQPHERKADLAKGMISMSEDFDEPLDDFNEYMK